MNIKPISDWVMISRPLSSNIIGSIHLPTQTGRTKPEYGTVMAVGRGIRKADGSHQPMQVKVGDVVTFRRFDVNKFRNMEILQDEYGTPYIFVRDRDLWSILVPPMPEMLKVRTVG